MLNTTAFKEYKEYDKKKPWAAEQIFFPTDGIITPPHYEETIEILIYHNVIGDAYFGGKHFKLKGDQVYFVAPNVVHAIYYKKNDGVVTTLKIEPSILKPLLDIETLLDYHNLTYSDLPVCIPVCDEIHSMANIFLHSSDIKEVMISIIKFFHILITQLDKLENLIETTSPLNDDFLKIISWTEKNFRQKITIDEAAQIAGYSKYYFCKKFKAMTGITYLRYLNSVRIFHACNLLKHGYSVTKVCLECGFDDLPYFTQLFKKTTGKTPSRYVDDCKKLNNHF